ncbi:oxidoreductase [Mammaliicoccus lentus]|uniref:oxidoreductase n=1 Tax=Mammaliicoccus lentus TaxID=42858 RepID=UPI001072D51A|nr:oxidoreductase [Mammaliicoccus lentus]MBF0748679.1 oxidoreductase [Mammaliicoccus lentus]TFU58668.1 oxidoreductase [Mammaliicoccus lentus]
MKKFGIIGPGAVGTAIAFALRENALDVTLLGRENSEVQFQDYNEQAIHTLPVASLKSSTETFDILFIAVKTTQLDQITPHLTNITHDKTVIILTQNGYGQLKQINHSHVYQAVVYISGQKTDQQVTHFRDWTLKLPINNDTLLLKSLTKDSILNIECIEDYYEQVWYKLLVNLGINTITAITRQTAKVLKSDGIENLCRNLLIEGRRIASAEGIHFNEQLIDSIMNIYAGYPDDMGTSMYYDVINHKSLEIEYIQGYLLEQSKKHQLSTPLIENSYAILNTFQPEV